VGRRPKRRHDERIGAGFDDARAFRRSEKLAGAADEQP
jgi:hypothetical protein